MKLSNYIGFTCPTCENSWEVSTMNVAPTPTCPDCGIPVYDGVDLQVVVGDMDEENGVYECFACGHTFSYVATSQEYPDETPNCTHCGSTDVDVIY